MASDLPILIQEPPSTPLQEATTIDEEDVPAFDANALSPLSGNFPRHATYKGSMSSPSAPLSPFANHLSPYTPLIGSEGESLSMSGSESMKDPFNFQSLQYSPKKTPAPVSADAKQAVSAATYSDCSTTDACV
jgi:hypothetical protein